MSEAAATATTAQQVVVPTEPMVLRLRPPGEEEQHEAHVQWDPDVVDNELLRKKKSNKCCIYHKPKPFDQSDSESSDDDSEDEFRRRYPEFAGKAPPEGQKKKKNHGDHGHGCCGGHAAPAADSVS